MNWNKASIDLKKSLVDLYTEEYRYRIVANESGLTVGQITFTGNADTDWSAILTEADKHNQVFDVITRVKADYAGNEAFSRAVEQYLQDKVKQRDSRPTPEALSPEIKAVYNNYLEVLQAKGEVTHWYDILTNANYALVDQEGISPENIGQVQHSLRQLNNLFKEEYRLLEGDSDLRDFFGQDCYELMRILSVVDEQSGDLIIKMQLFRSIYDPGSMISLEWQQDIQQNVMDILQKLQEIDDLMQPSQTQLALKGGTNLIEVTEVYQVPSLPAVFDQTKLRFQSENMVELTETEVLSKIDEKKLCEAIFSFYKMDELISLCSDLSKRFADPDMVYEKLFGRTAKPKIMSLIKRFHARGLYESLLQYLIQIPHFGETLQ